MRAHLQTSVVPHVADSQLAGHDSLYVAATVLPAFMVTSHVSAVWSLVSQPLHVRTWVVEIQLAVSVALVPWSYCSAQSVPQLTPVRVTVPVPTTVTLSARRDDHAPAAQAASAQPTMRVQTCTPSAKPKPVENVRRTLAPRHLRRNPSRNGCGGWRIITASLEEARASNSHDD